LGLTRRELKILIGLTGHITLSRHPTVMKIPEDPLYPLCGEKDETLFHFLGQCCAIPFQSIPHAT